MSIATNLRTLRFMHGEMTQEALARAVGVTRQTIIALETGRYSPSLELAIRLADVFGKKVDDVFYWKDGVAPPLKKKELP
jgi:putative transcriptional regulator